MVWLVLSFGTLGMIFVKLSAYLTLARMLSVALFLALLVIFGSVFWRCWRKLLGSRSR
jgi:hypothetical protein